MSHCDTCCCDDPGSIAGFNARIRRVLNLNPFTIPSKIAERLTPIPKWQFGFREFMPSSSTCVIAGMFLAAIDAQTDNPRFFATVIKDPFGLEAGHLTVKAAEYNRGDCFDIYGSPSLESLEDIGRMTDGELWKWLGLHVTELMKVVELAIDGEPVLHHV